MKRLITLSSILFVLLFAVFVQKVFAQEARSNPVDIIVGNPKETVPGSGEVPPIPSNIRQAIIDNFGITLNGFDQHYLELAWQSFWEVSNSKFFNLVGGTVIERLPGTSGSYQDSCPGSGGADIYLVQYNGDGFFKFIIIHELGHIVRNCNLRATIQYDEHINAYYADGGGVSYYGNYAPSCTGSDNLSEDYADMVVYYLRPADGQSTVGCDPIQNRPNPFFSKSPTDFPAHLRVAETVLKK